MDSVRAARRLPDTTTADFAAQWRSAEYMALFKHNGQYPSWYQNVGGVQLRRAAWQQVPSFRNTPVERSHIELWQSLHGLFCKFESLDRLNLLHSGDQSDFLELWCLHRAPCVLAKKTPVLRVWPAVKRRQGIGAPLIWGFFGGIWDSPFSSHPHLCLILIRLAYKQD